MKNRVLILKDNYNSFEKYYIDNINQICNNCRCYYKSNSLIRKLFTHFGLPGESFFYGNWKFFLKEYDIVIVFDSLHTNHLLKYIKKHSNLRLIYWHWNPIITSKEESFLNNSRDLCEHWTFNPNDVKNYGLLFNNQFFFFQNTKYTKSISAFFVGTDKGRYNKLIQIADNLMGYGFTIDFHIVDKNKSGRYYQSEFVDYLDVIDHLKKSLVVVEIVQDLQNGLTVRSLEAMFFGCKLITNNKEIMKCDFYNEDNIYIIGEGKDRLDDFLLKPFSPIDEMKLYKYSYNGWLESFE